MKLNVLSMRLIAPLSIEGLPLTNADKERISVCLNNPKMLDSIINELLDKHTV